MTQAWIEETYVGNPKQIQKETKKQKLYTLTFYSVFVQITWEESDLAITIDISLGHFETTQGQRLMATGYLHQEYDHWCPLGLFPFLLITQPHFHGGHEDPNIISRVLSHYRSHISKKKKKTQLIIIIIFSV